MGWRIGVDIGGTFIDFCLLNEATHELHSLKVLTTPDEPGREIDGRTGAAAAAVWHAAGDVSAFVHGTTVGINTVIQRKGADLALLTTAGFEDVIELARLRMPEMYSLFCARPEQLVPRDCIFGVGGRILSDGSEQSPLDDAAVRAAVAAARRRGVQGIIVAFINAYRNPAHEAAAKAIIAQEAPDLFVFTSAEVWPVSGNTNAPPPPSSTATCTRVWPITLVRWNRAERARRRPRRRWSRNRTAASCRSGSARRSASACCYRAPHPA